MTLPTLLLSTRKEALVTGLKTVSILINPISFSSSARELKRIVRRLTVSVVKEKLLHYCMNVWNGLYV